MNRLLIGASGALRRWPTWAVILVASATTWLGLATAVILRHAGAGLRPWLAATWLVVALYVVAGPLTRRAPLAALSWPLAARRLVGCHLLAAATACLGILLVCWGACWGLLTLMGELMGARTGLAAAPAAVARLLPAMAAWTVALLLVLQGRRPELLEIPRDRSHHLLGAGLALAGWAEMAWLPAGPAWLSAPPLIVAAVAGAAIAARTPGALSLAPDRLDRLPASRPPATAGGDWAAAAAPGPLRRRLLLGGLVLQGSAKRRWLPLVALPMIALLGSLLSTLYPRLTGESGFGFGIFMVPLSAYLLFAVTAQGAVRLGFLDAWPLSRSATLGLVFWPQIAALATGYAAAELAAAALVTPAAGMAVPAGGPRLPLLLAAVLALFFAVFLPYLRALRPGVGERARRLAMVGGLVLLFGLHVALFGLVVMHRLAPREVAGLLDDPARRLGEAGPAGGAAAWALALLVGWAGFEAAARSFRRAELAPRAGGGDDG